MLFPRPLLRLNLLSVQACRSSQAKPEYTFKQKGKERVKPMPMPSQNLRMMQGGRDLWRFIVRLQAQRCPLDQVYQELLQWKFERLQGWQISEPLSSSVPAFDCPQGEKGFLIYSWKFLSSTLLFLLPFNPVLCTSLMNGLDQILSVPSLGHRQRALDS